MTPDQHHPAPSEGDARRAEVHERLEQLGGIDAGVARQVARDTGVPEAEVYGVASFYHLLSRPQQKVRVCTGLSCRLAGADDVLAAAQDAGMPCEGVSCLAGCDVPPAVLRERRVLPKLTVQDVQRADGQWEQLESEAAQGMTPGGAGGNSAADASAADAGPTSESTAPAVEWRGHVGPERDDPEQLALNLYGAPDRSGAAFRQAQQLGPEALFEQLETSGLQGRGGAGFPAHIKWRAVHGQPETRRYVVLNGDEGEPGTFKDRELLMRRPDRVLEGLAIAAAATGAADVYLYLRGEFGVPWDVIAREIADAEASDRFPGVRFHMHAGQGAYICGEETALIEALEGKRGMPRLKPPFPVENGLWGMPTLMHNVETIACVPSIVERGGPWFAALGRAEAGTKLYCVSGHVVRPGTYELPLGVTLDELVAAAGGYVGTLKAFSPGGASSGFLPADMRAIPLDFKTLGGVGSMLGSSGVVVLNDSVSMPWAVEQQLKFFEDESCGQCAPCRIGTFYLHTMLKRHRSAASDAHAGGASGSVSASSAGAATGGATGGNGKDHPKPLDKVADAAWQMNEGSICGLGQAASLPLTTALKHFGDEFAVG
ncbi:MAG: hypothetical protein DRQ55_01460 [Planctomycetota bacterium]|nr:MAG: hypothetical protein DRQ55_01460 [Planctomycetota bacterium]